MKPSDQAMFPDELDVEVWAYGKVGAGGTLRLRRGAEIGQADLPAALMDTLIVLMRERLTAPADDDWSPRGFITMELLCQKLKQLTQGSPNNLDPDGLAAARYVMRLRATFADALPPPPGEELPTDGTPAWTKLLLAKHRQLGYRLAIPAERLHLVLAQPPPNANRV